MQQKIFKQKNKEILEMKNGYYIFLIEVKWITFTDTSDFYSCYIKNMGNLLPMLIGGNKRKLLARYGDTCLTQIVVEDWKLTSSKLTWIQSKTLSQ